MAEAVGLDARPVVDPVGRNVFGIDRHVVGCEGVGPFGADDGHQLVILVRNGDFGRLVADRVDPVVERRALPFVRQGPVGLEQGPDGVQQRFLGGIVRSAELFGALEHQVFQVMGQAGGLVGIVLAAHAHGDVGLQAGRFLVDAHVHLQPVVQGVDLRTERVALHGFIPVLPAGDGRRRHQGEEGPCQDSFHLNKCACFFGQTYAFSVACARKSLYLQSHHGETEGT